MTAENPRAVAGGNNPPDPLIVEANERITTASKWLVERPLITDMVTADKANFFISQLGATFTALDNRRKDENRDWLAKQDVIYKDPLALLIAAKTKLTDKRRDFLKREEDRLAIERRKAEEEAAAKIKAAEEAQRAAEAAAKKKGGDPLRAELAAQKAAEEAEAAQAKAEAAPERAQISGTYSQRATGLRDYWSATITDLNLALKHYGGKKHPSRLLIEAAIRECIQGIANKEAVVLKTEDEAHFPPGIKFLKERK